MENKIEQRLIISSSPHVLKQETTKSIMWIVTLCLLPATLFGFFAFGTHSLLVVVSSIISSIIIEAVILTIRKKRVSIDDGSAFLTGLLVGLNMPPNVPLYIPIISSIFAIGLVKQAFGGLGENWANPAITARVFALFAWTKQMTTWSYPFMSGNIEAISGATPLGAMKEAMRMGQGFDGLSSASVANGIQGYIDGIFYGPKVVSSILKTDISYLDLFFGYKGGCIGEISVFLLLVGALLLIYKKIITLDIPISFIGTVILIAWIFGGLPFAKGFFHGDFLFHVLTGGIALGAFFCATDMVTTPVTIKGRIIFGIGCGLITMLIRLFGGLPEGVSLAILVMNMFTPAIDRFIVIKPMGYIKKEK